MGLSGDLILALDWQKIGLEGPPLFFSRHDGFGQCFAEVGQVAKKKPVPQVLVL